MKKYTKMIPIRDDHSSRIAALAASQDLTRSRLIEILLDWALPEMEEGRLNVAPPQIIEEEDHKGHG